MTDTAKASDPRVETMRDMNFVLDTLVKMQSHIDRAANENEAAVAAAKMQSLMFKYGITQMHVRARVTESMRLSPTQGFERLELDLGATTRWLIAWRQSLAYGICQTNFCRSIIYTHTGGGSMGIIGRQENAIAVIHLYEYLEKAIQRLCRVEFKKLPSTHQAKASEYSSRKWKEGFYFGAVDNVCKRLLEQRLADEAQYVESKALVLSEETAVQEAFDAFFPSTKATSARKIDSVGYTIGRARAGSIALNKQLEG